MRTVCDRRVDGCRCGFPITEKELTDVWLSIKLSDDNMSTFNNVVMEFAPGFSTFRAAAGEGGKKIIIF